MTNTMTRTTAKKKKTKTAKRQVEMKTRPWSEVEKALYSPERIKANRAETARLLSLMELRKGRHVTQVELAAVLAISQATLSQLENQKDAKISTVRDYVAGLGGKLRLVAVFDDTEVGVTIGG